MGLFDERPRKSCSWSVTSIGCCWGSRRRNGCAGSRWKAALRGWPVDRGKDRRYVSVSSQTDAEQADIARETGELKETPEAELDELTRIHVARGLDEGLARQVSIQLTEKDALGAHSRDEPGISETVTAHPIQAALVSAVTFAVGAVIPLIIAAPVPAARITPIVAVTTLVALSVLGGLGASVGGADIVKGAIRVTFWGALAMAATAGVGMIFGVSTG